MVLRKSPWLKIIKINLYFSSTYSFYVYNLNTFRTFYTVSFTYTHLVTTTSIKQSIPAYSGQQTTIVHVQIKAYELYITWFIKKKPLF